MHRRHADHRPNTLSCYSCELRFQRWGWNAFYLSRWGLLLPAAWALRVKYFSSHSQYSVGKFTAARNLKRLVAVPCVFHVNSFVVCNDVPTIMCAIDKTLHRSIELIPVSVFAPSSWVFVIRCVTHRNLVVRGSFVCRHKRGLRQWSSIRDVDVLYMTARNTPSHFGSSGPSARESLQL